MERYSRARLLANGTSPGIALERHSMDPGGNKGVAIITGAAKGIGSCCKTTLAWAGFNVTLNYIRNREIAEETAEACLAEGDDAIIVGGDVSDDAVCEAVMDEPVSTWDRVDTLANNATITGFASASDVDFLCKQDFADVTKVNVVSAHQMVRAARSFLVRSEIASVGIISTHSGCSRLGLSLAFAASKGALNVLTPGIARALAPDIRVNAGCPGFVDSAWIRPKPKQRAWKFSRAKSRQPPHLNELSRRTTGRDSVLLRIGRTMH